MNGTVDGLWVTVRLSRRNLRDLLAAEDGRFLTRSCESGAQLKVIVESDHQHYTGRLIPPGPGINADHNE